MIVLDASVFVAYLDADDNHQAAAETLLADALDDELGSNPLTLAEVLVAPVRDGRLKPRRAALRDLELAELPFPHDTAVRLAQLRVSTGLRMPGLLCAACGGVGHHAHRASSGRRWC